MYSIKLNVEKISGEIIPIEIDLDNRDLCITELNNMISEMESFIQYNNSLFKLNGDININITFKEASLFQVSKINGMIINKK